MYYYCSSSGCGNRIEYQVTKPTSCPRCKTVFADLSKTVAKAKPLPEVMSIKASRRRELEKELEDLDEEEDNEEQSSQDSKDLSSQVSASKKAILKRARARKLAERGETDEEEEDETIDDDNDEQLSESKIKRLARELAASIDPSSIHIGTEGGDGKPERITFRDWCGEKQ